MRPAWCVPLLLLTLTPGCHVVDRAKSCGKLSEIAKSAASDISATTIPDSPSPAVLRKKAKLYSQLAGDLGKPPLRDQAVKTARQSLIDGLMSLTQHLLEAAQAIDAQKEFLERQKRSAERHEKILAEKLKYGENSGPAPPIAPPATSAPTTSAPQGIAPQDGPRRSAFGPAGPRRPGLPSFDARARPEGAAGASSPAMSSTHVSPHTFGYERAKRAAEAATRSVDSSIRALETACR